MRLVRMREHEVCEDEIQWRSFNIHCNRELVTLRNDQILAIRRRRRRNPNNVSNPCVRACEPEYVTGKPMVSEKENEAAVS